jgi:Uma2 family endonuclease
MSALAMPSRLSVEDYLAGEEASDVRHEFIAGEVYAMTGASRAHGLIALNLGAFLRPLLRGGDCQAFISDMKVRLEIAGDAVFYYPDLVMTCDPDDRASDYCRAPCLVVEILSPQTRRIDRREKFLAYTSMPSLRSYLLISQELRQVELFRRERGWTPEVYREGAVPLDCLGEVLPLEAIYEGVDLA